MFFDIFKLRKRGLFSENLINKINCLTKDKL